MVESKEKENREGHDQAMGKLCDLHVHLDFMSNGSEVAEAVARHGSMLFANTVSPNGFEPAMKRFGGIPNVGVGLGFHPWWVGSSDVDAELEIFDANIGRTRFIGEVGLDYGKRAAFSKEQQVRAFRHMVGLAAESGGKVLSIHAIKSAGDALEILKGTGALDSCTCIFHWFSGSVEQLHEAIRAGCMFSVNQMMSSSRRGAEYLKVIPKDRLLLETDAPPGENVEYAPEELLGSLQRALDDIVRIKGPDAADVIRENALRVFRS